ELVDEPYEVAGIFVVIAVAPDVIVLPRTLTQRRRGDRVGDPSLRLPRGRGRAVLRPETRREGRSPLNRIGVRRGQRFAGELFDDCLLSLVEERVRISRRPVRGVVESNDVLGDSVGLDQFVR